MDITNHVLQAMIEYSVSKGYIVIGCNLTYCPTVAFPGFRLILELALNPKMGISSFINKKEAQYMHGNMGKRGNLQNSLCVFTVYVRETLS